MNNIDDMPAKCKSCPYWEVCDYPYICLDVGRIQPNHNVEPGKMVEDAISRQAAIDAIHEDADWLAAQGSDWQVERMERDKSILKSLPPVQPKAYTKADYIMALHKEYGCTLTRAEEAHDKALEYLRSKAIVKG